MAAIAKASGADSNPGIDELATMPSPREVYEDPTAYWSHITASRDEDFEGQHFDRKEAGRLGASTHLRAIRDQMSECISAFANANRDGGLLVVGVGKKGSVKGLKHLSESQQNALLNVNELLAHHHTQGRLVACTNDAGENDVIALFLVSSADTGICETREKFPRAWLRQGKQNLSVSPDDRERLRRDKHLTNFEKSRADVFSKTDLDPAVVSEFTAAFLRDATLAHDEVSVLFNAGALLRDRGAHAITNGGSLFFYSNPQRIFPGAVVRLLRFDCDVADRQNRPLPDFDRVFAGSLTKQIRDFRTFLRESGFLKTYQRRNSTGGFIEEPELPFNVVDEALVNAVAHRDYGTDEQIHCEKYRDAMLIVSPGEVRQRIDLPAQFSLDSIHLESIPRNALLMSWLAAMRDTHGAAFVRALREGTRQMRDSMTQLGLPAPEFRLVNGNTQVLLISNAPAREAELRASPVTESDQFANLYPLSGVKGRLDDTARKDLLVAIKNKLEAMGWFIDRFGYGTITAHIRGVAMPLAGGASKLVGIYPAYTFQIREYEGRAYACVDYTITVQNLLSLAEVRKCIADSDLVSLSCLAEVRGWLRGKITEIEGEFAIVRLYDYDSSERVVTTRVIPHLPVRHIESMLASRSINLDLNKEVKKASLLLEANASRTRAGRVQNVVEQICEEVFPVANGTDSVGCSRTPLPLVRSGIGGLRYDVLGEPSVEVGHKRTTPDIRDGVTRFGGYDDSPREVEVVPVASSALRERMESLIERLRTGKFRYHGSERTFSTRLTYRSVITADPANTLTECERLLKQHPEWVGDPDLARIFLVHTPESGFSLDDENSPYYRVKRILLEAGVPCQMVDTPTLLNPDWKDLNLALNIVAKTGGVPWVLPESIPDADFFIGLSYTQSQRHGFQRILGFANVFNEYGRWEFYSASANAFSWDERARCYEALVEQVLSRLHLSETPSIYFHYSAKFSKTDREAIVRGARKVRPNGKYSFVWLNSHHHVRLYDARPETDGSLGRGSYVIGSRNQLYLSTTGFNPYRKTLGTPQPLEVNIRVEAQTGAKAAIDLRAVAMQILSLTKLNWASTDALCGEPITTKYAGEIAYLTAAFLRQGGEFKLHSVLERTPWFI